MRKPPRNGAALFVSLLRCIHSRLSACHVHRRPCHPGRHGPFQQWDLCCHNLLPAGDRDAHKALSGGRCGGLHGVLLHGRQICRGCAKASLWSLEAVKSRVVSKCHAVTSSLFIYVKCTKLWSAMTAKRVQVYRKFVRTNVTIICPYICATSHLDLYGHFPYNKITKRTTRQALSQKGHYHENYARYRENPTRVQRLR